MATTTYKHLLITEDNVDYKIQVDSAIRDGQGAKIDTQYAKCTELPEGTVSITLTSTSISDGTTTMQTDQTYNASSANAQSGVAVASAIQAAIINALGADY